MNRMKDSDKVEAMSAIEPSKYENIDLDRLAVYAVGILNEMGVNLSFENCAVACFKLFPKKFSLTGFPSYPDSDRIRNCLNRCTRGAKQWLGGKALHGFKITEKSALIIREAEALLTGQKQKSTKAHSQTRRKESLISELKGSSAYEKFTKGEAGQISESDLCFALQGTLDSSRGILRENLKTLVTFAAEIEDKEALKFLHCLEEKFRGYLNSAEA